MYTDVHFLAMVSVAALNCRDDMFLIAGRNGTLIRQDKGYYQLNP